MNLSRWDRKTLKRYAIFVLAAISLFVFVDEIFGPNGYLTLRHQKAQYTRLKQQIQTLSEQNQQLEQKIKALKSNPEAIEKQARDQLHLVKPGELVYMLPDKKSAQSPSAAQQASTEPGAPQR